MKISKLILFIITLIAKLNVEGHSYEKIYSGFVSKTCHNTMFDDSLSNLKESIEFDSQSGYAYYFLIEFSLFRLEERGRLIKISYSTKNTLRVDEFVEDLVATEYSIYKIKIDKDNLDLISCNQYYYNQKQ